VSADRRGRRPGTPGSSHGLLRARRAPAVGRFADYYPAWFDKLAADVRLLRERLAETPYGGRFLAGEA